AETQTWLEFALSCKYLDNETYEKLYQKYDFILGKLVNMSLNPNIWSF
ncbi:four helix bundle protein, partial [Bacteroidota bacterium]